MLLANSFHFLLPGPRRDQLKKSIVWFSARARALKGYDQVMNHVNNYVTAWVLALKTQLSRVRYRNLHSLRVLPTMEVWQAFP